MASKIAMTSLDAVLSLISTIGNGSFIAIFVRFKNLRNFPNILLANLAAVDFLNAVINVPMHTLNYVWKSSWMKGKTPAVILSSLQLEFTLLNMVSMFAIMLDRFLALYLDLKYYTWKTTRKAYAAVVLIWLICTLHVALSTIPLLKMDMEADTTLGKSREKIFQQRKGMIASTMGFFIAASTAFGVLTVYAIYQNKRKRKQLNLPALQAEGRIRQDIKAAVTVAMAVLTYFICYVPAIVFVFWSRNADIFYNEWIAFLASFCTFISSASNPIIYVLRNKRYHDAIRQLVKDPLGSSLFQEMPVKNRGKKQRKPGSVPRKIESEEPGARPIFEIEHKKEGGDHLNEVSCQMVLADKIVKIAWKENEERSCFDQACQNLGLKLDEAEDQDDSSPADGDLVKAGAMGSWLKI